MSEAKKAPAKEDAKPEKEAATAALALPTKKVPEYAVKKSWGAIKVISNFFGKRLKAVVGGIWEATGGQITGELGEIAQRLGFKDSIKEKGILSKIAGISEGIAKGIDNVLGKVAGPIGRIAAYPLGLPLRIGGRLMRGTDDVAIGGITGQAPNAGKTESGAVGGTPAAAAA